MLIAKDDYYFINPETIDSKIIKENSMIKAKNLVLFVTENDGMTHTLANLAKMIKAPGNKLYDTEVAKEYGITLLTGVYSLPLEMFEYIIENRLIPDASINSLKGKAHGKKLVQDNLWFIVRFFQPELFGNKFVDELRYHLINAE